MKKYLSYTLLYNFTEREFFFQGQVVQEFSVICSICAFCMARFPQFFLSLYLSGIFFVIAQQWFIPKERIELFSREKNKSVTKVFKSFSLTHLCEAPNMSLLVATVFQVVTPIRGPMFIYWK